MKPSRPSRNGRPGFAADSSMLCVGKVSPRLLGPAHDQLHSHGQERRQHIQQEYQKLQQELADTEADVIGLL